MLSDAPFPQGPKRQTTTITNKFIVCQRFENGSNIQQCPSFAQQHRAVRWLTCVKEKHHMRQHFRGVLNSTYDVQQCSILVWNKCHHMLTILNSCWEQKLLCSTIFVEQSNHYSQACSTSFQQELLCSTISYGVLREMFNCLTVFVPFVMGDYDDGDLFLFVGPLSAH